MQFIKAPFINLHIFLFHSLQFTSSFQALVVCSEARDLEHLCTVSSLASSGFGGLSFSWPLSLLLTIFSLVLDVALFPQVQLLQLFSWEPPSIIISNLALAVIIELPTAAPTLSLPTGLRLNGPAAPPWERPTPGAPRGSHSYGIVSEHLP